MKKVFKDKRWELLLEVLEEIIGNKNVYSKYLVEKFCALDKEIKEARGK